MHINEDHFLAEVIDPHTGERLPLGATGELVLTSLTREAVLVLHAMRDATVCACGQSHAHAGEAWRA